MLVQKFCLLIQNWSIVWKEFELTMLDDGTYKAICKCCKKDFVAGNGAGTSHLKYHIGVCSKLQLKRRKFGILYRTYDDITNNNSTYLHKPVPIPLYLRRSTKLSESEVFLSHVSQLLIHGLMACVLIDGHIARDVCWNSQFT